MNMSKYKKKNLSKIIYNQEEIIHKIRDFKNRLNYQPNDSFFNTEKSLVEDDISFCKIETNYFWEQVIKYVHPRNTIKRINYKNNQNNNSHISDNKEKLQTELNNLKTQISEKELNIESLKSKLIDIDQKNKMNDDNETQIEFKINALNKLNDKIETKKKNIYILKEKAGILTKLYTEEIINEEETNILYKLQHLKDRMDSFYSLQNKNELDDLQKMQTSICKETLTDFESLNPKLIIKHLEELKSSCEKNVLNCIGQETNLKSLSPKITSYWLHMKDDLNKLITMKTTISKLNIKLEEKFRHFKVLNENIVNKKKINPSLEQKFKKYVLVQKEIIRQNYLSTIINNELKMFKESNFKKEISSQDNIRDFNNSMEITLKNYEINLLEIKEISQRLKDILKSVQSSNELITQDLGHFGENINESQSMNLSWLESFVKMPLSVSHVYHNENDLLEKVRSIIFENHLNELLNHNVNSPNEESSLSMYLPTTPQSKSIIVPNSNSDLNRLCRENVNNIQTLIERRKQNVIVKTIPNDWILEGRTLKDYHEEYINDIK